MLRTLVLPVPNAVSATNGERHCQIHYCTCEWGVVNGLWRSSMLFPAANFYSCNYKPFVHHRHHCQIPPPTTTLLSAILLSATLLRAISSKLPLIRNNFNFHNPSVFVLVLDSASSIFFSIVLPTPHTTEWWNCVWHWRGGKAIRMFCHGKKQHCEL